MSVAFSAAAAGRRRAVARGGGEHVVLLDPARGAAALDVREVDALGLGDAARDGRDADAVGEHDLLGLARLRRLGGPGLGAAPAERPVRTGLHPPDHLADGDGVPGLGEDLPHHARGGRGDLGVDLVGGDLDDRLVVLHLVAGLLGPLEDDALGDRLAHRGHRDLDGLALALGGLRPRPRWACGAAGSAGARSPPAGAVERDLGEQRADVHGVALGGVDLDHGARRGGRAPRRRPCPWRFRRSSRLRRRNRLPACAIPGWFPRRPSPPSPA